MNYRYLQSWMILLLILSMLVAIAANPYEPAFSIYNEEENGASHFREALQDQFNFTISRMLISPIILNANASVEMVIIIGSERKYTSAEINAYEDFVNRGGMLVIFEDFGPAKSIATRMGITFLPGIIRETTPELKINRPTQIFIQDLLFSQVFDDFFFPPLLVSEAVGLIDFIGIASGSTFPLLMSFPTAYVDTNNNNKMEFTDFYSPLGVPVGLMKLVGDGLLMVFGDSSLPLNRNWQRHVSFLGQDYILSNGIWLILVLAMMMNAYGKASIVFDESHQQIEPLSASGILNLILGTWVGILNTLEVSLIVTFITIFYSRRKIKEEKDKSKTFKRTRDEIREINNTANNENPTDTEKGLTKQYMLYNVMKENFIQVANSNLIEKLRKTGKAHQFLDELAMKFGVQSLDDPMTFDKLVDLHNELREYVDQWGTKWLR